MLLAGISLALGLLAHAQKDKGHLFNQSYTGEYNSRVAFPIGGLGAGMFCLEGTGAISHMSVRNNPDLFNEPLIFAAISIKDMPGSARVLEGPVPGWKKYGQWGDGRGAEGTSFGLARFREAWFRARFPFGEVGLRDDKLPLAVTITGWSPFIPTDADNSSLPVGGIEYRFTNTSVAASKISTAVCPSGSGAGWSPTTGRNTSTGTPIPE